MGLRDIKALGNVRNLVETVERAFEEPWSVTTARLLGGEWLPRVDVRESEKSISVTLALPEMKKDDLHISVTDSAVSIRGSQKSEENQRVFYRSLSLPASVRPDDVKAVFKDGILRIDLPKAKHTQVRRVAID